MKRSGAAQARKLSAWYQRLPDDRLSQYHVDICEAVAAGVVEVDFSSDPLTFWLTDKGLTVPVDPEGNDGISRILTVMRSQKEPETGS